MPYIQRDAIGKMIAISETEGPNFSEFLSSTHPDVVEFVTGIDWSEPARSALANSVRDMARVIDDLIDVLIRKQVILYTDLPEAVKQKVAIRNQLRDRPRALENPIVIERDIF